MLIRSVFPDRFDELVWMRWFPTARTIDEWRMPTVEQVAQAWWGAGLQLQQRHDARHLVANDFDDLTVSLIEPSRLSSSSAMMSSTRTIRPGWALTALTFQIGHYGQARCWTGPRRPTLGQQRRAGGQMRTLRRAIATTMLTVPLVATVSVADAWALSGTRPGASASGDIRSTPSGRAIGTDQPCSHDTASPGNGATFDPRKRDVCWVVLP